LNEVVAGALRLVLRIVVVAMGLVLFLSLLAAALVLALAWLLRALWARLTGRPVTPWVMRMDPRSGFRAAYRWSEPRDADASARRGGELPGAADVTDVQPREVREP